MERLFAPWRIHYVKSVDDEDGCFFCRYVNAPAGDDRENLLLHRGAHAYVLMNRYPYTGGHLMVARNRHGAGFAEMSDTEALETLRLAQRARHILTETVRCHGMNIGWNLGRCAGAGVVEHLHLHLVPRWDGDTNFVPVLSDVRVIPQALEELYDELRPRFDRIGEDA